MSSEEKARKYDEIVRIWNAALAEHRGDVWYELAGHPLANRIQDVIADDIDEVIKV